VKAGVFHGEEPLCKLSQTSIVSSSNPRWNETLTLNIPVCDIPRSGRFCLSICSVIKPKKKTAKVLFQNFTIYDCNPARTNYFSYAKYHRRSIAC